MNLEILEENIKRQKELAEQILILKNNIDSSNNADKLRGSLKDLISQLNILNNAVPNILKEITFYNPLDNIRKEKTISTLEYTDQTTKDRKIAPIKKEEEEKYLKSLSKTQYSENQNFSLKEGSQSFGSYARISNKLFKNIADDFIKKGYFEEVKKDLRKIASPIIISSYISMGLFTAMLSWIIAILLAIGLGILFKNILLSVLIAILSPVLVFILFMFSPSSQRSSFEKSINNELPFLTIYMAAISTSGIEPSKIFSILGSSGDYPATRREIKKLTNYINFYGYDLVSALRMVSKSSPSERFAQLLDGLATAITSGGELTNFLNKHADTLLFDYRLEREKYTRVAETFMNIYISVVIAAPMILMILFILMSVSGFGGAFLTAGNLGMMTMLLVAMLNLGFIVFLNAKQPKF
jgi:flagellar protein FlaJ